MSMDAMALQEVLMTVISVAGIAGGTACIIRRENRSDDTSGTDGGKQPERNVKLVPQNHAA